MRILTVDTSTQYTFLALCDFNQKWNINKLLCVKTDRRKDNWLELLIHEFCDSFPLNNLDGFAAGYGPGSFTGLRINFTYLKTLAILWDKLFLTFSTSRFFHSLFCKIDEALLVQTNRTLYFSCDPDQDDKADNIRSLAEWTNHYSQLKDNLLKTENALVTHKKIKIWNQYPQLENSKEKTAPEFDPQSMVTQDIVAIDMPDPDFILKNKKELMNSMPFYGHDLVASRKL
ncbi:MAG: hypothetical protein OEV78_06975 [Spirochaetia bacterium]|nr:hypothetical protein [Spirochaetia bacterium]